jgi:hypothetical protein
MMEPNSVFKIFYSPHLPTLLNKADQREGGPYAAVRPCGRIAVARSRTTGMLQNRNVAHAHSAGGTGQRPTHFHMSGLRVFGKRCRQILNKGETGPFWLRHLTAMMSALGHKPSYALQQAMSALPLTATAKADMGFPHPSPSPQAAFTGFAILVH